MNKLIFALLVTIAMTLIGVLGDTFLKMAGSGTKYIDWKWFVLGLVLYASTALGWFFVLKHIKLATLGAIYSILIILFLAIIGVVYFKEALNMYEISGIGLAIVSLVLLTRFA